MPILSKPSSAAQLSLIYITVGALTDVWSGIWYWNLSNNPEASDGSKYWCYGFLLTGLTLFVIGIAIGRIGRAARHAELPPEEVTRAAIQVEQNAASRAPVMAPVNPAFQPTIAAPAAPATAPLPGAARVAVPIPPGTLPR